MMTDAELVSCTEAATLLGVSRQNVNLAIREGRLPAIRVGKQNVIRRVDLAQYHPREYPRKGEG